MTSIVTKIAFIVLISQVLLAAANEVKTLDLAGLGSLIPSCLPGAQLIQVVTNVLTGLLGGVVGTLEKILGICQDLSVNCPKVA